MARAIRTLAAEQDLLDLAHFIAVDQGRPSTAERIIDEIIAKCDFYAGNSTLGVAASHLGTDHRLFRLKRWVIMYRPIDDGIEVLRIVDGARDYPTLFGPNPPS